jgi:hypothetical protein
MTDDFLSKFVLLGLPAVPFVMAIAELIKRLFKIDADRMPWVAVGSGFAVAALMLLIDKVPQAEDYVYDLIGAVLLALAAMGAYSGIKALKGYVSVPEGSIVKEPSGEVYRTPPEGGTP